MQYIDALAEKLLTLAEVLPNFHVIDTRGLLRRAEPDTITVSHDSENEIYPTAGGY